MIDLGDEYTPEFDDELKSNNYFSKFIKYNENYAGVQKKKGKLKNIIRSHFYNINKKKIR